MPYSFFARPPREFFRGKVNIKNAVLFCLSLSILQLICCATAIALNDASTLQETVASREHWCRGPMGMGEELGTSIKGKDQCTSKIEGGNNRV